jgi:hypothetical protein
VNIENLPSPCWLRHPARPDNEMLVFLINKAKNSLVFLDPETIHKALNPNGFITETYTSLQKIGFSYSQDRKEWWLL